MIFNTAFALRISFSPRYRISQFFIGCIPHPGAFRLIKRRKYIFKKIVSLLFLLALLGSEVIIYAHKSYTISAKGDKTSISAKCSICDMQYHNHLLFQKADPPDIVQSFSEQICIYRHVYAGVKLTRSRSRAPPLT